MLARERRFAVSYIESQVSDKTSLVKVVHTFVTKLLSVIPSKGSTLTQCDYKVPARFSPGRSASHLLLVVVSVARTDHRQTMVWQNNAINKR